MEEEIYNNNNRITCNINYQMTLTDISRSTIWRYEQKIGIICFERITKQLTEDHQLRDYDFVKITC